MTQKIEAPTPDDLALLARQRDWVHDHYDPAARDKYDTVDGKLRLLDAIIRSNWVEPSETWKLQSLGVTFGDALVQELSLIWIVVDDSYGRDPALQDQGTTTIMYPLTMISKRIERGESVDVYALFDAVRKDVLRFRGA